MSVESHDKVYTFGGFTLDARRGTVSQAGVSLFLRPKPYRVLTILAENLGRVVPKAELMDAVWPGVFVTEDSLTQSIREIRKALGEEVIRTVSRRGYMLTSAADLPQERQAVPVLAVLRFRNEMGRLEDELIVDGFAEDLINGLTRFRTVTVLARSSSFSFGSFDPSERPQVQARIGADYLVEGSLRRQGGSISVSVNLIAPASGAQLWGERYDFRADRMLDVQWDIVEQIVGRLVTRVDLHDLQRATRKHATSLAAYELTLSGLALLRAPAQDRLEEAAKLFAAAIAKNAADGLAHSYLALATLMIGNYGRSDKRVLTEARIIAENAVSLAPDQAAAHRVLSLVQLFKREHEAAEHRLKTALELNPMDAECIEQMGYLLITRGRPLEALQWLERAIRINPLHPHWYHYDRALAHYLLGDYQASARGLEVATQPKPWIRTRLAACYAKLGDVDRGRIQIAMASREFPAFSQEDYARNGIPFERKSDADHFADGILMLLEAS